MKLVLLIFACFLSVGLVSSVKNRFNDLVDEVLYEMEHQMLNQSKTEVSIKNINETFSKKVLFFTVDGSVSVQGGSVKNLSTIYRVGDVVPTQTDSQLIITATFSMSDLSFKAEMLDLKISFIHIHDPVSVVVGTNAASFNISLMFDEDMNCKSVLNSASISKLGDFKISLGESGILTGLEADLADYVLNKLAPTIQTTINDYLTPMVNQSIQALNLCNKLM